MGNLAINLVPEATIQLIGMLEPGQGGLVVRLPSGVLSARRAASCLLEPEAGDRAAVLLDTARPGVAFVVAVLERSAGTPSRLLFEGDVQLAAPSGRLDFVARDRVEIATPGAIEITGATLAVRAIEAQVAVERSTVSGSTLSACVDRIKLVANSLDSAFDRITQRVRMSLRRVEELDQLRAGQVEVVARDTITMHGANTIMTADRLVKVDGEQIHVG